MQEPVLSRDFAFGGLARRESDGMGEKGGGKARRIRVGRRRKDLPGLGNGGGQQAHANNISAHTRWTSIKARASQRSWKSVASQLRMPPLTNSYARARSSPCEKMDGGSSMAACGLLDAITRGTWRGGATGGVPVSEFCAGRGSTVKNEDEAILSVSWEDNADPRRIFLCPAKQLLPCFTGLFFFCLLLPPYCYDLQLWVGIGLGFSVLRNLDARRPAKTRSETRAGNPSGSTPTIKLEIGKVEHIY